MTRIEELDQQVMGLQVELLTTKEKLQLALEDKAGLLEWNEQAKQQNAQLQASLKEARAALSTIPSTTGWRTMETAPKDGSTILAWREDAGCLLVRWTSASEFLTDTEQEKMPEESLFQSDWFYADFISGGRMEGGESPTHWMPLPLSPDANAPSTDFIHKEQVRPIVEALNTCSYDSTHGCGDFQEHFYFNRLKVNKALQLARELGLAKDQL